MITYLCQNLRKTSLIKPKTNQLVIKATGFFSDPNSHSSNLWVLSFTIALEIDRLMVDQPVNFHVDRDKIKIDLIQSRVWVQQHLDSVRANVIRSDYIMKRCPRIRITYGPWVDNWNLWKKYSYYNFDSSHQLIATWANFLLHLIFIFTYRKISNISHTSLGDKIIYHWDVVGASPVGAAPTTSSFLT